MKKSLYIALTFFFVLSSSLANDLHFEVFRSQKTRKEMMQLKRDFFVKELNLTEKEANDLMPVMQELDEKRFELWRSTAEMHKRIRNNDPSITEAEMGRYMEKVADNKIKEAELEKEFIKKCKEILPMEKAVRLPHVNRKFAGEYMKKRRAENSDK